MRRGQVQIFSNKSFISKNKWWCISNVNFKRNRISFCGCDVPMHLVVSFSPSAKVPSIEFSSSSLWSVREKLSGNISGFRAYSV